MKKRTNIMKSMVVGVATILCCATSCTSSEYERLYPIPDTQGKQFGFIDKDGKVPSQVKVTEDFAPLPTNTGDTDIDEANKILNDAMNTHNEVMRMSHNLMDYFNAPAASGAPHDEVFIDTSVTPFDYGTSKYDREDEGLVSPFTEEEMNERRAERQWGITRSAWEP